MITKHDIENIERAVRSMSQAQYDGLLCWLSNGAEGDLWDCVQAASSAGRGRTSIGRTVR
jgi:hypothetical protein